LVNVFDTGQASRVLEFPNKGLAYIVKQYCNVTVDKKYQLADWRVRPLPSEMITYARQDTHYLLYICDCLRNESINRGNENNNLLLAILSRSRDVCLLTYEKEISTPLSYMTLYNKFNINFDQTQLGVFAALYDWRDRTSRREDESLRYVLPNHMLFHISQEMPLDSDTLFSCINPVPPLVRANVLEMTSIIRDAKVSPQIPLNHEMELESSHVVYNENPSFTPIDLNNTVIKKEKDNHDFRTPNDVKYNYNRLTEQFNNKMTYNPPTIKKNKKLEVITTKIDDKRKNSTSLYKGFKEEPKYSSHETAKIIKNSLKTDIFKPKYEFEMPTQNNEITIENVEVITTEINEEIQYIPPKNKKRKRVEEEENENGDALPQTLTEKYDLNNKRKKKKNNIKNNNQQNNNIPMNNISFLNEIQNLVGGDIVVVEDEMDLESNGGDEKGINKKKKKKKMKQT